MKEYIAREVQTDTGGYIETVSELIRCKDCTWCFAPKNGGWADDVLLCSEGLETKLVGENDFCSNGSKSERKEE